MKFKIFAKKDDGTNVIHYFDNITLDVTTENGIPVYLKEDPRCAELAKEYKSNAINNAPKQKEQITNIRITLGFNCNFHCKYCHERELTENVNNVIPIHANTESLDEKVNKLVDRILTNLPNLMSITFWGGEPLVYFKTMKKIVSRIKEKKPEMNFSTITNGSLLTLPVAKWLAENKIRVTISHDGPSFNVYRDDVDPLKNPKTLEGIQYLFDAAKGDKKYEPHFNIVITPENCNLQKFDTFFKEALGREVPFGFESIVKLDTHSEKIVRAFDAETTRILLNNLVAYGSTQSNNHPWHCIRDHVSNVMRRLVTRNELPNISCFIANKEFIPIDMEGNVLICHGMGNSYCKLEDVDKVPFNPENTWKDREECASCPFLISCLGGCPVAKTEDHKISCNNLKIWHAGFFIAAWKLLFDSTIYRIEPVLEE